MAVFLLSYDVRLYGVPRRDAGRFSLFSLSVFFCELFLFKRIEPARVWIMFFAAVALALLRYVV